MSHYKPYPAYRDSGVEWIGRVPEHWAIPALKFLVSTPITDGPHETPDPDASGTGVLFVSAEAVSSGKIDFDKAWGRISRADHERYSKKYRPMLNDIYMVKSGATTGVTAIVEDSREFNIWSPLAAIRSNEKVLPRFLLNALRSASFKDGVALNWSYGTQQNIGMKVLENLPVQLPPLSEQVDIIETIDRETARIDALILKKSRFVELLEEKRLTVITTAVTKGLNSGVKMKASGVEWIGAVPKHWAVCKLSYRYSVELGKMLDEKKMTGKNPVPYLRNKDVQWQQINVNDLPIIDITPQEIDRYTVKSGDLLVCEGGDVGRAAIWRGDDNVIGYQKALHRLPPVSG